MLLFALTDNQIIAAVKLTKAAKSSDTVHPNSVAIRAVNIGAIPPAIFAHVFIKPESDPEWRGVKSMHVAHQLGAAKLLKPAATANSRMADVLLTS